MDIQKHVILEVRKVNSDVLNQLWKLEEDGYLKRIRITKDGKLDKRTIKK